MNELETIISKVKGHGYKLVVENEIGSIVTNKGKVLVETSVQELSNDTEKYLFLAVQREQLDRRSRK